MKKLIPNILLAALLLAPTSLLAKTEQGKAHAGKKADHYAELVKGNQRFIRGESIHPAQGAARRKSLVQGQAPHTIVLSCSDSRVPPEIVFDQGLGQLFVVRVAGNTLTDAVVASIEYAAEHLHAGQLLVMGHESCGAIKATLGTPEGQTAGSPDLDALVASIRPHLKGQKLPASEKGLVTAAHMNVDGVIGDLLKRSVIVKTAVEQGHLSLVGGVYRLESGQVELWKSKVQ